MTDGRLSTCPSPLEAYGRSGGLPSLFLRRDMESEWDLILDIRALGVRPKTQLRRVLRGEMFEHIKRYPY